MQPLNGLDDAPTRALIEALVKQPEVRVRKRWARLQLALWQQAGWVEPLAESDLFRALPLGLRAFNKALLEHELRQRPDAEMHLQRLGLELPARCHRQVLAALLKGSREQRWRQEELSLLAADGITASRDGLLRARANVPFSLFFRDGAILDAGQTLALSGELCLPEEALGRLQKLLWQSVPPERIVTVEQRAAYVTLPLQAPQLVLLTPPGHTELGEQFISSLTPNFHWYHHTDLHPQAILRAISLAQRLARPLELLLPARLPELLECYGQRLEAGQSWSGLNLPSGLQQQLAPLMEQGMWLEQESMVLFC